MGESENDTSSTPCDSEIITAMRSNWNSIMVLSIILVNVGGDFKAQKIKDKSVLTNLLNFAPLLLKNEQLKRLSDTLNFHLQNTSYNDIFKRLQSKKVKEDEGLTFIKLDDFKASTKENVDTKKDDKPDSLINIGDKMNTQKIDTDKLIREYIRIMEDRMKVEEDNNTSSTEVEQVSANLNRFFYSGVDWTLNLLPTLLIIKIAFIAGSI